MARIAMLLPNGELMEQAAKAAEFYQLDLCFQAVITDEDLQEKTKEALEQAADIIIARGRQARRIREHTEIPVVDLKITPLEIGVQLGKAVSLTRKEKPAVALIGPKDTYAHINLESLENIYPVCLRAYLYQDSEDMMKYTEQAIKDGADIIMGGEVIWKYCTSQHIPCLKAVTGTESALEACRTVGLISSAMDQEKRYDTILHILMTYTYNGVIQIDENCRILYVNRFVENLLMMEETEMKQKFIWNLIPSISRKMLQMVLERKKKVSSAIVMINSQEFLVNILPVVVDKKAAGAVISFHEGRPIEVGDAQKQSRLLEKGYAAKQEFQHLVARSRAMQEVIKQACHFAAFQLPILICGESGTEKQALAESIHNAGVFRGTPFIRFNCNGYNPEEIENLLFEKENSSGLIYRGPCTLYLHEVSDLPLEAQYRLFVLLQREPYASGILSPQPSRQRIRVIASTEYDLRERVKQGTFRKDLYYSLTVMKLRIPPLRERPEDVLGWIEHYMSNFQESYERYVKLTADAKQFLQEYQWPGNLIELRAVCSRLLINCRKYYLDRTDVAGQLDSWDIQPENGEEQMKNFKDRNPEAERIVRALHKWGGNREKTAQALGISTATLWRRMKKYDIGKMEGKAQREK